MMAHRLWTALAVIAAGALASPTRGVAEIKMLSGPISWSETGGGTGQCLFQGKLDGTALNGFLFGQGTPVTVTGTLGTDGAVSGSLSDGTNTVGSFSATLDESAQLLGGFAVLNGAGGQWSAPAENLPVP